MYVCRFLKACVHKFYTSRNYKTLDQNKKKEHKYNRLVTETKHHHQTLMTARYGCGRGR